VAKRKLTVLVDDIDGSAADGSVIFGIDGAAFEVDLAEVNEKVLRESIAKFCGAATRLGKWQIIPDRRRQAPRPVATGRAVGSAERNRAIRAWAEGEGISVSARGRISASVIARYEKAQQE
jgi:hypothetical protein